VSQTPRSRQLTEESSHSVVEKFVHGEFEAALGLGRGNGMLASRASNFFELGGHSLAAGKVDSRTCQRFNLDIPVSMLCKNPTVVGFAKAIQAHVVGSLGGGGVRSGADVSSGDEPKASHSTLSLPGDEPGHVDAGGEPDVARVSHNEVSMWLPQRHSLFDLALMACEGVQSGGLTLSFQYCTALFETRTIQSIGKHLLALLTWREY
jgi:hypothetical protein